MNADENFLARWSRHKQEAQREAAPPAAAALEDKAAPDTLVATAPKQATPPQPPEARLPTIDFSQPGALQAVLRADTPVEISRAALRQAWRSDPVIRDFIGLSENSFDFTAPELPGFGPLSTEQVQQLLARAIGETEHAQPASSPARELQPLQPLPDPVATPAADRSSHATDNEDASAQHEIPERLTPKPRSKRHGSALPEIKL